MNPTDRLLSDIDKAPDAPGLKAKDTETLLVIHRHGAPDDLVSYVTLLVRQAHCDGAIAALAKVNETLPNPPPLVRTGQGDFTQDYTPPGGGGGLPYSHGGESDGISPIHPLGAVEK